jgi:hypothetical protein
MMFAIVLACALQAPPLPAGVKPATEGKATEPPAAVSQGPPSITYKDDLTQIVDTGNDTDERDVSVTLGGDTLTVTPKKGPATAVAYAAIGSMTYDRRSRMRRMAPTYGKRIQHFLTIQFKYPDGRVVPH